MIFRHFYLLRMGIQLINVLLLPFALFLALYFRFSDEPVVLNDTVTFLLVYGMVSWIAASSLSGLYHEEYFDRPFQLRSFYRTLVASLLFVSFVGLFSFVEKDAGYSRIVIMLFALFQFLLVLFTRAAASIAVTLLGASARGSGKIIVVGDESSLTPVLNEIHCHPAWRLSVVGYVSETPGTAGLVPWLGGYDSLKFVLNAYEVDDLLITLPLESHLEEIQLAVAAAESEGVRIQFIPEIFRKLGVPIRLSYFGSIISCRIRQIPLDDYLNRLIKRSMDLICTSIGIVLLLPLLVPVMILIKLADGGPIFFTQKRTGHHGAGFTCLKFRSMTTKDLGISPTTQPGCDDPRLLTIKLPFLKPFPLGRFLRNSNIDELPQLVNVLRGEMSLVGPRPHMVEHTDEFRKKVDSYMVRHYVRPGITGLAQVNGYRGMTDTLEKLQGRVHYDIKYIENWSIFMDIKILLLTLFSSKAQEREMRRRGSIFRS